MADASVPSPSQGPSCSKVLHSVNRTVIYINLHTFEGLRTGWYSSEPHLKVLPENSPLFSIHPPPPNRNHLFMHRPPPQLPELNRDILANEFLSIYFFSMQRKLFGNNNNIPENRKSTLGNWHRSCGKYFINCLKIRGKMNSRKSISNLRCIWRTMGSPSQPHHMIPNRFRFTWICVPRCLLFHHENYLKTSHELWTTKCVFPLRLTFVCANKWNRNFIVVAAECSSFERVSVCNWQTQSACRSIWQRYMRLKAERHCAMW